MSELTFFQVSLQSTNIPRLSTMPYEDAHDRFAQKVTFETLVKKPSQTHRKIVNARTIEVLQVLAARGVERQATTQRVFGCDHVSAFGLPTLLNIYGHDFHLLTINRAQSLAKSPGRPGATDVERASRGTHGEG